MRHPEYYFEDGTVVLFVDECLFKVHRYYLMRESEVFSDMFALPSDQMSDSSIEGQTDDSPIVIPEVSRKELESFLSFIYFGMHDDQQLSLDDWVSLLSFATRFVCEKIRRRAIRQIDNSDAQLDPVEKVVLAVKHTIPQWLLPAYQELCERQDSLTLEEGMKLGMPTVIKLMRAREMLVHDSSYPGLRQGGVSSSSQFLMHQPHITARPVFLDFFEDGPQTRGRYNSARVVQVVKQVFELE